jgi:hypothetical protein
VYRPWVVEPGTWAQWDWGHGPKIDGRQTWLFCAWLAWSRFRIVIPVWDKTLPTVITCLDRSMRAFGGVPTYWLTDNERTVSTGHIAGIAVRHRLIVQVGHHYVVTIATCVPADPESKGGVERTVQIAKADLVPTDTNLLDHYASWAELVDACDAFMGKVNGRKHRITRRAPAAMLAEEQPPSGNSLERMERHDLRYVRTAITRRWSSGAWARPSFVKIRAVWVSTVRSLITSRSAIAWLDRPSATSECTSCSRSVSSTAGDDRRRRITWVTMVGSMTVSPSVSRRSASTSVAMSITRSLSR